MKLQELLKDVAVKNSTAAQDIEIKEVRYDSRAVQQGDLFVAIRGYATDGHKYIAKAMEQGAAAVVCEEAPEGVPAVVVENSRIALAEIAANRFGHPAESMVMLGVTGTNGKTTTTYLVKHMLEDAGHKVGLIGTNQNLIGDEVIETERTTPESYELHALFARMRDAGGRRGGSGALFDIEKLRDVSKNVISRMTAEQVYVFQKKLSVVLGRLAKQSGGGDCYEVSGSAR